MADLTIPIIGLTTLVGYFFSKSNESPQPQSSRTKVADDEKPVGANIYESNRVDAVNKELLQRSQAMYEKAKDPATTGVLPPLFNTYSVVGNQSMLSPNETIVEGSIKEQTLILDTNRLRDVTKSKDEINVNARPMFRDFIGKSRPEDVEDKPVSLLTGLPIEQHHNNMTPFFGSNIKQNVEEFSNETLLDLHTGNTSSFKHKREVGQFFSEQPQDIHGTPTLTTNVSTDRYVPSLYRQNEKAFDEKKVSAPISGTFENNIRPVYKEINDLRVGNRLQETFDGRTIAGQMGSVRGAQSDFKKNRPDTFYEKGFDHLFKTTGQYTAPTMMQNYSNMKLTSRNEKEYIGGSSATGITQRDRQRYSRENDGTFDAVVQTPKKNNFENDYQRNVAGSKSTNDFGKSGYKAYETERATTGVTSHLLNANKTSFGMRTSLSDVPKSTHKESMLSGDNSGYVKTKFDQGIMGAFNAGVSSVEAKTTQKETTHLNNYKGIMSKEEGMGYLVNKYEAQTTGKEIISNNSAYTGSVDAKPKLFKIYSTFENQEKVRNAVHARDYQGVAGFSSENKSRENFANAEIRDDQERIVSGERPPGPQKFQVAGGKVSRGETKYTPQMMFKEREDDRERINVHVQQVIPSKELIGVKTKVRFDNGPEDTVTGDRLNPELFESQHALNPFSIYGKKTKFLANMK